MKKITVTYELNEKQYARLLKITDAYKKRGSEYTPEDRFESIMLLGCDHYIDKIMQIQEMRLCISGEEQP